MTRDNFDAWTHRTAHLPMYQAPQSQKKTSKGILILILIFTFCPTRITSKKATLLFKNPPQSSALRALLYVKHHKKSHRKFKSREYIDSRGRRQRRIQGSESQKNEDG